MVYVKMVNKAKTYIIPAQVGTWCKHRIVV